MNKQITVGLIAALIGLCPFQPAHAEWDHPTLSAMSEGLDAFWGSFFDSLGVQYTYPVVYSHDRMEPTPCGPAMLAHYCPKSNSIHLNIDQMNRLVHQVGDSAAYFSLAHEYGHSVQRHLGILKKETPLVTLELQADCLAGAFFAATNYVGLLEPGDLEEGIMTAMMTGDYDYKHSSHHGTPQQRARSFLSGFHHPKSCFLKSS
ncbi:neutral zinc metallopeptidase [Crocosphaera sp. UHCC 0190]|uniref:neutral zinc metallopeptidase n=1 Tax=Crocosphaera sp. UHCC 0190 TaxID=3110246 RepID=UPI002B211CA3|nr:neutral zinc metallopeptidase [Crocosphaera sp. UHCC 0190]MEA5509612.1 neutral zinc metallopeptidase [Crocosphaera sp. UHCC 0190]